MSDKKKSLQYGIVVVVLVLAGAVGLKAWLVGPDYEPATPMIYQWEKGGGTPAVRYDVEIRKGGSKSTDIRTVVVFTEEVTIEVDWLTPYEVRVRGIDVQEHVGPWSLWSEVKDRDHDAPSFE